MSAYPRKRTASFDHLISDGKQRRWGVKAERPRRVKLERFGLLTY